jgi:hypothetical protein
MIPVRKLRKTMESLRRMVERRYFIFKTRLMRTQTEGVAQPIFAIVQRRNPEASAGLCDRAEALLDQALSLGALEA